MIYGALEILRSFLRNPAASRDILRALPFTLRGVEFSSGQIVPSAQRHPDSGSHDEGPPNDATSLQAYFNSYENGPGIHKWLHYFDIYERHFKRFVGREVHVLEIGVESGGSLRMWRGYFGHGC